MVAGEERRRLTGHQFNHNWILTLRVPLWAEAAAATGRIASRKSESLAKPGTSVTISAVVNRPRPRGLYSGTELPEGFSVDRKTSKRSFIQLYRLWALYA
jgi:hypothetical protein